MSEPEQILVIIFKFIISYYFIRLLRRRGARGTGGWGAERGPREVHGEPPRARGAQAGAEVLAQGGAGGKPLRPYPRLSSACQLLQTCANFARKAADYCQIFPCSFRSQFCKELFFLVLLKLYKICVLLHRSRISLIFCGANSSCGSLVAPSSAACLWG